MTLELALRVYGVLLVLGLAFLSSRMDFRRIWRDLGAIPRVLRIARNPRAARLFAAIRRKNL
jgi:hypothetical protein